MRLVLLVATSAVLWASDTVVVEIPPVKSAVNVKGQAVSITSWGAITRVTAAWGKEAYRVAVTADLSDLQRHITEVLAAQLNKNVKCGEVLEVQKATLVPSPEAGVLTAYVRYERTLCARAFGREISKKMVAGNGVVEVKLRPVVEANRTVRLAPEVTRMDADGSLGDVLRSGQFGDRVKEKIEESMVTSIQKAANLLASLPPEVQKRVSIQDAQFRDTGGGHLAVVVTGEVNMTSGQERSLAAAIAGQH